MDNLGTEQYKNDLIRIHAITGLLKAGGQKSTITSVSEFLAFPISIVREDFYLLFINGIINLPEQNDSVNLTHTQFHVGNMDKIEFSVNPRLPGSENFPIASTEKEVLKRYIDTFYKGEHSLDSSMKALKDIRNYETFFYIKRDVESPDDRALWNMAMVNDAIQKKAFLTLSYENRKGHRSEFSIYPLMLVQQPHNNLYIAAYENDQKIHFARLDRIRQIKAFTSPQPFSLPDFNEETGENLKYIWGSENSKVPPTDVTVEIEEQTYNIIEKIERDIAPHRPFAKLEKEDKKINGNNAYLLTAKVKGLYYFALWVRGYGSAMEVLEPPELRETIIRSAKHRIKNYEDLKNSGF